MRPEAALHKESRPEALVPVPATAIERATASPQGKKPVGEHLRPLIRWESALVIALVLTVLIGAATSHQFLTSENVFSNVCLLYGELALMTLPMTLVILSGEIDLSIASTLALSSSLVGYLWENHWSMPLIIICTLVAGLVCGTCNGLLVTRLGLPSLAVTIGTMTLYEGISEIILGPAIVTNLPARYTSIGVNPVPHTLGLLSYSAVIFVVLAVIFGVVLHATPFGRSVVAIGWNKEAAQFAGIRVKRVKTLLFMVSGLVGSMAGVLYTFRLSTSEADNGTTLVLPVVAAVLLGGVSIFGGKGTLYGVVLAVLVYCGLQSALLLANFNPNALEIVTGGLLLLSVLIPNAGELADRARRFVDHYRLPGTS
ncbi:MAG TPA: ABC transporter permease [Acidimicrobiales bacterium]|nr:ABC transporter permease [Acidimicrobiales bacterium]